LPYDAVDLPAITTDTCASLTVWMITCVGMPRFGVGFDIEAVHEIATGAVLLGAGEGAPGALEGVAAPVRGA